MFCNKKIGKKRQENNDRWRFKFGKLNKKNLNARKAKYTLSYWTTPILLYLKGKQIIPNELCFVTIYVILLPLLNNKKTKIWDK